MINTIEIFKSNMKKLRDKIYEKADENRSNAHIGESVGNSQAVSIIDKEYDSFMTNLKQAVKKDLDIRQQSMRGFPCEQCDEICVGADAENADGIECNECSNFYCYNCKDTSETCATCNITYCENCKTDKIAECDECYTTYCTKCSNVEACKECETYICDNCSILCIKCGKRICKDSCHEENICGDCFVVEEETN